MASSFLQCCNKLVHRYSTQHRSVLCMRWILPIRMIAIGSLFIHIFWRFFNPPQFYSYVLIIFHIIISIALISECKKSEIYHLTIKEFDRTSGSTPH